MSDGSVKSIQYNPGTPFNPDDLLRYVNDEFIKISDTFRLLADGHLDPVHVEPDKPREGDIRFADGTNWDPGCGRGPYTYLSGAWEPLVTQEVKIVDSLGNVWELEQNGAMPINIQDQHSPTVIVPANKVIVSSTLAAATTIDAYTCTVVSAAGMSVGDMLILTTTVGNRYYTGRITNIAGAVLTVATPFDYAFESGQQASACETNMAVDGSSTRQIFSLRAAEPPGGIAVEVDVTRIIWQCQTSGAVDLSKFADIAAGLTNGVVCRRVDGDYYNVFTVKTNSEIQNLGYDLAVFQSTNPTQGQDGFSARLTFGSQGKVGVTLRIGELEDLEFIIQDDLSSITDLHIMIEGHIVTD